MSEVNSILGEVNVRSDIAVIGVHYVINCKGEAGRYRIDAYNDHYQAVSIDEATYKSLLVYLSEELTYKPLAVRGEALDCYAYTIIKIKDGAVTDILP